MVCGWTITLWTRFHCSILSYGKRDSHPHVFRHSLLGQTWLLLHHSRSSLPGRARTCIFIRLRYSEVETLVDTGRYTTNTPADRRMDYHQTLSPSSIQRRFAGISAFLLLGPMQSVQLKKPVTAHRVLQVPHLPASFASLRAFLFCSALRRSCSGVHFLTLFSRISVATEDTYRNTEHRRT